jgi:predicted XRE-type DNA-binding protein
MSMGAKLKMTRDSGNVFLDAGFAPDEANNLMLLAQLMSRVRDAARGASQREAAKRFGINQPRLNDVSRGRIVKFSLDALVNLLAHAGMRVELRVKKAA